jgi:TM2 domain-containing membrane protein YozV
MSMPGNARMSMIGCGSLALPKDPGRRSALIAALLSLLMPGLGQVYVGRPVRGAVWFFAVLALEAAALYAVLNQPRFWLLVPIVATLLAAVPYQIVEAAVLARRSAPYSLRRYNK